MTRRLTVGSRSEMGLPHIPEPDTPISQPWPSSYKSDVWRVPSRWQTSRPRFRQILKFLTLVVLMSVVLKIYYDKDLPKAGLEKEKDLERDPSIPDQQNWPWKDFPL